MGKLPAVAVACCLQMMAMDPGRYDMKRTGWIAVLTVLLAIPVTASAQGFYIGGGLGYVELDDDLHNPSTTKFDDSSAGIKLLAGYEVNQMLGLELQLSSLGLYETDTIDSRFDDEYGAFTLVANGRLPLGGGFFLFGQAGFGLASLAQDYAISTTSGTTPVLIEDTEYDSGSTTLLGLGFEYRDLNAMNQGLGFRIGYEQYDFDVDRVYLNNGILYSRSLSQTVKNTYAAVLYYF